jgi:hypothetical protein
LITESSHASLEWMSVTPYKPTEIWIPRRHRPSIDHREEMKTTTMASKDDNKHKYAFDGVQEEAEEAPSKKQKMIGGDDSGNNHNNNGEDHGGDDNGNDDDSCSLIDDDYSLEPEEEVS